MYYMTLQTGYECGIYHGPLSGQSLAIGNHSWLPNLSFFELLYRQVPQPTFEAINCRFPDQKSPDGAVAGRVEG